MAALVLNTAAKKISFFTTHVPVWAVDPPAIGTSAEHVAQVQGKLDAARAALAAQQRAAQTARSATLALKIAMGELDNAGGQVIGEIKARARVGGSEIYSKASIRPPASPSPIGKPGTPTRLSVELTAIGSLRLGWKCKHPRGAKGTSYQVWRRLDAGGEFTFLGASGKKKFMDMTIPAGTRTATYRIIAFRSTARGDTAEFPVNLGVNGRMPVMPFVSRGEQRAAA